MTESFMDWPLSKFHEMEDKKMMADAKKQDEFTTHISNLYDECYERGKEVERQAAEILELQKRNATQAETIIRLREELEMHRDRY